MPRIPDVVLHSVFFLYPPDFKAATEGKRTGGCGFIVTMKSERTGKNVAYGVTARHVVIDEGNSFARINRKGDASPEVFDFDSSDWTAHPEGYDLAAIQLDIDPDVHAVSAVPMEEFAQHAQSFNKGLGDDVFMVGRFVDHDGADRNSPSVRFGNIAVMPTLMEQQRGRMLESYIIDMRSRTGYSGSPVFIYRAPGADFDSARRRGGNFDGGPGFLHLLGVHWAQFPEWQRVFAQQSDAALGRAPSGWAEAPSAMTCVVPAERLLELLRTPKFATFRTAS